MFQAWKIVGVLFVLCAGLVCGQEEAAVAPADVAEAAAVPAVAPAKPGSPQPILMGGLRRRVFSDRDSQKYRIDEESVYATRVAAVESGDITPDMSIVEEARVIFKLLQKKPENSRAFEPLTRAKTPQERLAAVKEIFAAVKSIIRILEMFESFGVLGEMAPTNQ